jgi:hypothetical protein
MAPYPHTPEKENEVEEDGDGEEEEEEEEGDDDDDGITSSHPIHIPQRRRMGWTERGRMTTTSCRRIVQRR